MKRDWNVIRDILTAIEEDRFANFVKHAGNNEEWMDGLDADEIEKKRLQRLRCFDGHVRLLIDAGLISKINSNIIELDEYRMRSGSSPQHGYSYDYRRLQLSMDGHDLLQHMREPKIWNKVKSMADQMGVSLTMDFVRTAFPKIMNSLFE